MTLGEIIKQYRYDHNLSMNAFSEKSGISKAYVSLLEKNKHPKTGKAIAPSIKIIKQVSEAINVDFDTLFSLLEGEVVIEPAVPRPTTKQQQLLENFDKLNARGKDRVIEYAEDLSFNDKYKKDTGSQQDAAG